MRWIELEERVLTIIKYNITDREKAELILIEFNQYKPNHRLIIGGKTSDEARDIAVL